MVSSLVVDEVVVEVVEAEDVGVELDEVGVDGDEAEEVRDIEEVFAFDCYWRIEEVADAEIHDSVLRLVDEGVCEFGFVFLVDSVDEVLVVQLDVFDLQSVWLLFRFFLKNFLFFLRVVWVKLLIENVREFQRQFLGCDWR